MPLFQPPNDDAEPQITRLLEEARAHYVHKNNRKAIDTLHSAQQLATQNQLHAHASQLRRAISILATGGRPKLLSPTGAFKTPDP